MKNHFFIFLFPLFFVFQNVSGQRVFSVATNLHYGFVIPHRSSVVNLIQGHSKALEINLDWSTQGNKPWHLAYNNPSVGIDLLINSLGNDPQLGNLISTMGYVDFPLGDKKHHFFKTGVGLGYATKIWDLENNPKNVLLSSHFNAAIHLQYRYTIDISKGVKLNTGIRITHFSNGSLKLPNKGINNASVFIGMTLASRKLQVNISPPPPLDLATTKKHSISSAFASGMKQISLADKKKYSIFSLSTILDKRISAKTSWGIGVDLFYNTGLKVLMKDENGMIAPAKKAIQIGGLIGYTKHLYPWEIKIMAGVYLHDNYKLTGAVYNRFGLRYFVSEHLFAGMFLKTHYARADFGELGMGYTF